MKLVTRRRLSTVTTVCARNTAFRTNKTAANYRSAVLTGVAGNAKLSCNSSVLRRISSSPAGSEGFRFSETLRLFALRAPRPIITPDLQKKQDSHYSEDVLQRLPEVEQANFVLADGDDLALVLGGRVSLSEAIPLVPGRPDRKPTN
jgi:hypothetical protein